VHTTAAPLDAVSCAASTGKELHYKITYLDSVRLRTTMEHASKAPTGAEVDVMGITDRLTVAIVQPKGGAATGALFTVQAQTVLQEMTKRGLTESERPASDEVKADADTVIARCAQAPPASS
jgi:hypothetical protein